MPDPIELAVTILSQAPDAEVSTARPRRYVMVALDGDMSTELLLMPRLSLTCWGASDRDAHGLATSAWEALSRAAEDHDLLSSCQLESMSRDEWSRTGQSRYLAVVDLTINV